ncbi:axonemal dynein light chain domain-containing protein 1 isoform X2 [Amia ocellicauda]|uniref:axonemal dynein light chain domain-containing protein 1 isoform X2 n=1 Tax=Amia ocellicauda TaxID=2972642 RepID=UPI003464A0FF
MSVMQPPADTPPEQRIMITHLPGTEGQDRDLKENIGSVVPAKILSAALQDEFIPEEILMTLTSVVHPVSPVERLGPPKISKTPKDFKGHILRGTDPVWHHPVRRNKFKYFIDQPTSLTGAGRDISFLCDAVLRTEKDKPLLPPTSDRSSVHGQQEGLHKDFHLTESLIPEEYHIVKNKGVLGLEYYEDKYTVLLEDEEKKLRVFPSMKPSGRFEAIQLMKVMDDMLAKAGVTDDFNEVKDLSQMHSLLELVKKEQSIYNVVFHELIRQVSVECAERGELLSKLRQRYVLLMDRIPRQLKSLHTETLAQRALDRRLTEEIIGFKGSVGKLNNELVQVREHDLRVSRAAERAQEELARALQQSQKNADLVGEYHDLYELQRRRLESQLARVTEEKDLWSRVTYRLALKVINANNLHIASKLQVSEQTWAKAAEHFTVLLKSKDTEDLSQILRLADHWKEMAGQLWRDLHQAENSGFEKVKLVEAGIAKWQTFCDDKIHADMGPEKDPEQVLFLDLREWEEMLTKECERYGGERLLSNQETLKTMSQLQEKWVDVGLLLFSRHLGSDGKSPPAQAVMMQLGRTLEKLHKQLGTRITGDSGIHKILMSLVGEMELWSARLNAVGGHPGMLPHSDWLKLTNTLCGWTTLVEQAMQVISSSQLENEWIRQMAHVRLDIEEVCVALQEFLSVASNTIESENSRLTEEVSALHSSLTQWMVQLLLQMAPDCGEDTLQQPPENEASQAVATLKLEEEATHLMQKLDHFTKRLTGSCQAFVEEEVQKQMHQDEPEDGLYELQKLQRECSEWSETCQILLSEMKGNPVEGLTASAQAVPSDTDLLSAEQSEESFMATDIEEVPKPHAVEGWKEESDDNTAVKSAKDSEGDSILRFIGLDGNIREKTLREATVSLQGSDAVVGRPKTPSAQKAFDALAAVEVLHQELLSAEERAQRAEERTLSTEEQLHSALEKIQDLERQLQGRARLEEPEEKKVVAPIKVHPPEELATERSKSTLKKSEKHTKRS